jgi:hypothetical protein
MNELSKKTVERYKNLLNGTVNLNSFDTDREISLVSSFSIEERFYLAKNLLDELDSLKRGVTGLYPSNFARFFSASLLDALVSSVEVPNDEWQDLVDNCSLTLLSHIIFNSSLPVEILISENAFGSHSGDPLFLYFQYRFGIAKLGRHSDIVHHFRGVVPNSEHMSDEMVLSVAGVNLGTVT